MKFVNGLHSNAKANQWLGHNAASNIFNAVFGLSLSLSHNAELRGELEATLSKLATSSDRQEGVRLFSHDF